MRHRVRSQQTLVSLAMAMAYAGHAGAQPLPGADDGTRSRARKEANVEESGTVSREPSTPTAPEQAPAEDDGETAPTLDPARPPPKGKGVIWGVVRSKGSNDTMLEAVVSVLGRTERVVTDEEGRFRLELPPGSYQLRVVYELYAPVRVRNVIVRAGVTSRVDIAMTPDASAVEEVSAIEAEAERASAATQLTLRKNAAQASDGIGAQDIAKTPDRNAAEAAKRVVGATVVDGRYLFIRGLGDRYTNSLLNGSPLPSPEPDRQSVPLDMFPTLVLSDLTISKTFLPNMPGDFAGGSLNIHTRDFPSKFLFQVTGGLGFNTQTTFGRRLDYQGSSTDWLGIDDGARRLPSEVPSTRLVEINRDGSTNDLSRAGRAINRDMELQRAFNLPSGTLSTVVGDSIKLGGEQVLGYVVGGTYSRRFQKRTDEILRTYGVDSARPGQLALFNDYASETGLDTVTWSGLGSVSYALNRDHRIALTGLVSRNAEKEARSIEGFSVESGTIRDERMRFLNRAMLYGQLRGEHRFRSLSSAILTWTALASRATMNDPALRETVYVRDADGRYSFRDNSTNSGQNFFAAQGETTKSASLDWQQPLASYDGAPKLSMGGMVIVRGRTFQSRRFRFLRSQTADPEIFRQSPKELFVDDNIGRALVLDEWTRPTDSYAARYDVMAGYAMADLPVTSRLRFVMGPRVESATQTIDSFDPFAGDSQRVTSRLVKTDVLPSVNAIVKLSETSNLRLSATRTVARPQLRELAPFVFTDFLGAREVLGNPALERTRIANFDARVEFFPRVGEVLALSVFHKEFEKPIETFIIPTSRGVVSYQNAKGAVNTGLELEGRKALDFIRPWLSEFSLLANVTFVRSRVELDPSQGGIQTSVERPLAGQSPFVVNFALDYNHEKTKTRARALYNVQGARIAQVGTQSLPDTYEQPRHVVDVSVAQSFGEHVDLKLTIENLLDAPVKLTQGERDDIVSNSYRIGQTAWLLATYSH